MEPEILLVSSADLCGGRLCSGSRHTRGFLIAGQEITVFLGFDCGKPAFGFNVAERRTSSPSHAHAHAPLAFKTRARRQSNRFLFCLEIRNKNAKPWTILSKQRGWKPNAVTERLQQGSQRTPRLLLQEQRRLLAPPVRCSADPELAALVSHPPGDEPCQSVQGRAGWAGQTLRDPVAVLAWCI